MNNPNSNVLLSIENITKRFPGVVALDCLSFDVRRGEVLGLLGENGAGKSTILKIISGAQLPDTGTIVWDGHTVTISSPQAAQALGIVTIYQEFNLVPTLSVAENIFIGREPLHFGRFIDWSRMRSDAAEITKRIGLSIDPDALVSDLSVAEQQMVEIARAIVAEPRVLLLDEPAAGLGASDVDRMVTALLDIIKVRNLTTVIIEHDLHLVSKICTKLSVLHYGRIIAEGEPSTVVKDDIVIEAYLGKRKG